MLITDSSKCLDGEIVAVPKVPTFDNQPGLVSAPMPPK